MLPEVLNARREFAQRCEQSVDFLFRVVVDQPDSHYTTGTLKPEPFRDVDGVEVAVPCEDSAIGKIARKFLGRVAFDPNCKRRHSFIETRRVANAVVLLPRN